MGQIKQLNVLIVDNLPIVQNIIHDMLTEICSNFVLNISKTNSVFSAKYKYENAIINDNPYNIGFIDINLEKGSGFDILKYIREYEEKNNIKIVDYNYFFAVLISAHDYTKEINVFKSMYYIDYFVNKPFTIGKMKSILKEFKII